MLDSYQKPMTPDTIIKRRESTVEQEIDGETVLLSLGRGQFCGLNDVGSDIWSRIGAETKIGDLCAELGRQYEGDPTIIERETITMLDRLLAADLIDVVA